MSLKDKFIFSSIVCLLACIGCVILFVFITTPVWLQWICSVSALLFLIGFMACLRAIGEIGLWENKETKPIAEARFKYGYMFHGWLF